MNTAAVAIGGNKTGHLTPLGGAASGAERFAHWAEAQGMDVTTVTDTDGPVRLNDILDVIEPIVRAQTYDKLVVFFAGHGFLLGPLTELWLLQEPWFLLPKRAFQGTALLLFGLGAALPSRRMAALLGAIALPLAILALATVRAKLA